MDVLGILFELRESTLIVFKKLTDAQTQKWETTSEHSHFRVFYPKRPQPQEEYLKEKLQYFNEVLVFILRSQEVLLDVLLQMIKFAKLNDYWTFFQKYEGLLQVVEFKKRSCE